MTRLENGNWELVLDEFNNDIKRRMVEEKFIMIPRQSSERIPELLCACDAAFLSFQNDPLWKKTIPAKLQSYTACGMPIIAVAEGETERIINESGCGIYCKIGDANRLSEIIVEMLSADLSAMRKIAENILRRILTKKC